MTVRALRSAAVASATLGLLVLTLSAPTRTAGAATPPVGLGTAASYAVLAGSTIANTGASVLNGDRGLSPGTAVTGFPPGLLNGAAHTSDAEALQAQNDLTVAYTDAAGRTPATSVPAELGGSTFNPGVYVGATLQLTGTMTIDAGGDPDAVFLFKTNSTLITASNSSVVLIGSANPCNIYWQVSSSATLGIGTDFVGTVMASASITANTGADVIGRLMARSGAVTLDNNTITLPTCDAPPPATTTTTPGATTTSAQATTTTGPGATTTAPGATTTSALATATTTPGTASTTSTPASTGSSTTRPNETSITVPDESQETTTTTEDSTPGPNTPTTTPGTTTSTLARTGSNLGVPVGLGLLALAGGAAILAMRRRLFTAEPADQRAA